MRRNLNLTDLVKSFPTNIFLQNLASIQKRTSPIKFAHFAEKSEKGSISNLSTKVLLEMDPQIEVTASGVGALALAQAAILTLLFIAYILDFKFGLVAESGGRPHAAAS